MGQEDLKKKFERVHLQSEVAQELNSTAVEKQKIRFKNSSLTEIHQQIKNAKTASNLDWKNLLTSHYSRPALSNEIKPVQHQIQWTLNRLLGRPVLLSFLVKNDEASVLDKINKHMQERNEFWLSLLEEVTQIHLRTVKGKLQIWLKTNETISTHLKSMQSILENEYIARPHELKSFQVKNLDDWIEVLIDVDWRNSENRYKGREL